MKLFTILVLYLAVSQISLNLCGTITRSHRHRTSFRSRRTRAPADNKWYNLFIGILWGVTSKEAKDFAAVNQCFPTAWQAADPSPALAEESAAAEPKSTFTQILDGVEKVISFICNFKDNLKSLFSRRVRRMMRRQKYRMFVETRMVRYSKALGFWSDIVATARSALGTAASWVAKAWNDVKTFGGQIIENVKMFWDQLKAKIKAFINSDFVTKAKAIVTCLAALGTVVKAVYDIVKGIIERVASIATIFAGNLVALAKLFIDLICNFGDFREAFTNLADGLHETNQNKKYGFIGRFIGKLVKALTTKKLRKLRKH
jgi:hypothetical protein